MNLTFRHIDAGVTTGRILIRSLVRKGNGMLWNLGTDWLLIAVAIVGVLSFIVAMGLNAIMGEDGFGATGNAVIITAGFFLAIFSANSFGYRLTDLKLAVAAGLIGAFACLAVLIALKAALNRL